MTQPQVKIFDTTLRDGEQSPGCSMNLSEKIRMAEQLDRLGVDILEAGFPIASEGDFEAVRAIARQIRRHFSVGQRVEENAGHVSLDRVQDDARPVRAAGSDRRPVASEVQARRRRAAVRGELACREEKDDAASPLRDRLRMPRRRASGAGH